MKRLGLLLFLSLFVNQLSAIELLTKEIEYEVEGVKHSGYLAVDTSNTAKRPGVLVFHEWWGHNDYARQRAEMLAQLGYVAFAVDMYGDDKHADHPKDAGKFAKEVFDNMPLAEKKMLAALDILHAQQLTDTDKTAAIGYCFGGAMVLHLARTGADIDVVASFHGSLGTQSPANEETLKAKVLVFHGAADPFIPPEQVEAFLAEMKQANADLEFISYPDVKHSFTSPAADVFSERFDLPALEYNEVADKDSWSKMLNYFESIF